jgi:hypothetical protein
MPEMESGHPDELTKRLHNWLKLAHDPLGSLPAGVDPVEWAVRNFIRNWKGPVRSALDNIEGYLRDAARALQAGNSTEAEDQIDLARQCLQEDLRNELGLYDWNREE